GLLEIWITVCCKGLCAARQPSPPTTPLPRGGHEWRIPLPVGQGGASPRRCDREGPPTRWGRIFPKHAGDLLEATVVAGGMREGAIEPLRIPQNPLDVLAQQLVAACALEAQPLSALAAMVRRA